MKIDFIISSLKGGGAERVLIVLANALATKGYEINIITFGGDDSYVLNEEIQRIRLHTGKIKNHTLRRFISLLKHYKLKKNRPKIVISFLPPISFVTIPIAKLYGIKIIASEHINYLQIASKIDRFTREYLYRYTNFTTVLTKFDLNYYKKNRVNVVVMPNPCSFDLIERKIPEKNKDILAVGSLNRIHHKGFDNLIKLIAPILEKNPGWKLKIIGDGDGLLFLEKLVLEYNIQNKVEFTGFKNNIAEIMQNSEIYVLPSRFEGLPMALLEAMSQGMACIAYDCKTGPSDIISNLENGLLIPDQNMEEMQNGLSNLIKNPSLRSRLGENAIRSLKRFSIDNVISDWEKLFAVINN